MRQHQQGCQGAVCVPQGLSKSLARLEGELGCPLFERTYQGLNPTRDAKALYVRVRDLMDACEQIRVRAERSAGDTVLSVASASGTLSYVGLDFPSGFECENPSVELRMEDLTNRLVDEALTTHACDIGFLVGPIDTQKYDAELFSVRPHLLIVDRSDPLAAKTQVAYTDLEGRTVILLGRDHPLFKTFTERLTSARVVTRDTIGVAVLNDMLPMVSRDGAVLVSANFWAQTTAGPNHAIVPFEDKTRTAIGSPSRPRRPPYSPPAPSCATRPWSRSVCPAQATSM